MKKYKKIDTVRSLEEYLKSPSVFSGDDRTWTFEGLSFKSFYEYSQDGSSRPETVSAMALCQRLTNKNEEGRAWQFIFRNCGFRFLDGGLAEGFLQVSLEDCNVEDFELVGKERVFFAISDSHITDMYGRAHCKERLRIRRTFIETLAFEGVVVEAPVLFYGCSLGSVSSLDIFSTLSSLNFNSAVFSQGLYFYRCLFFKAPCFFGAQLHADTSFKESAFLDVSSEGAWRAYRTLKHHMMKFESDHETQMFHALELEARYNTELPKGWKILSDPKGVETIASWFVRAFNNYGQHLWLPFIWLLYIGCWFLVLYAAMGGVGYFPAEGKNIAGWIENAGQYYSNVTFAARNFFGPFGLILSVDEIQPNNMLVKTLGVLHFIISSVIWFIWILQIRSRFKL